MDGNHRLVQGPLVAVMSGFGLQDCHAFNDFRMSLTMHRRFWETRDGGASECWTGWKGWNVVLDHWDVASG